MNLPQSEITPDDPERLPPARRRRARRMLMPLDAEEKDAFYERLARRASPSFDFFLFSLLAGAVLGLGLLFDRPVLLVLAAVLAPLMSPVIGVALGTTLGSGAFFTRSLAGFLVGCLFVFGTGIGAGYLVRFVETPLTLHYMARLFARLSWLHFGVLALAAAATAVSLAREGRQARVYSVLLAFGLYLPLSVAGFGLTSGLPHLWPDALVVFLLYFVGVTLLAALVLGLLGYRPRTVYGYSIGGALALAGLLTLIGLSSAGMVLVGQVGIPTFTPTPTLTPTLTLTPSITPSPTLTPTPTRTPVPPTPTPTPVLAVVNVPGFDGARIRERPQGPTITVVANGTVVQILPEDSVLIDDVLWYHVLTPDGLDGWMVAALLNPVEE